MLFNETVLNTIRNFIPYGTVLFDDKNSPWMSCQKIINDKNLAFKRFLMNKGSVSNNNYLEKFSYVQKNLSSLIETWKQECFWKIAKKLSDPNTSSKTCWSILRILWTGKKVPCIPPILHDNKFINFFFSNHCSVITNTSDRPTNCESLTDKSLSNISFTDSDIGK